MRSSIHRKSMFYSVFLMLQLLHCKCEEKTSKKISFLYLDKYTIGTNAAGEHFNKSNCISNDEQLRSFNEYDVISDDDKVQNQYKMLPFPPVPEKRLLQEEQHYKTNSSSMFSYTFQLTLESLNHYLYQGKNHFR